MNYHAKLSKILKASGLAPEVFATKLGISAVTINAWLSEKSTPTEAASLAKIDALYVTYFGEQEINTTELAAKISAALANRLTAKTLRENQELLDAVTLNLTYHTNAIEGSTMTKEDVGEVLFDNKVLKNRTAIEQREAINHRAALNFLIDELADESRSFSWTPDFIRAVHLRLMNGIISDAGFFRNHQVRILGAAVPLANFMRIEERLISLCQRLNADTDAPLRLLAETHADFEQIHPFSDGNGRTGRLIIFAKSLQRGLFPPIIEKERKPAYFRSLQFAQMQERFEYLESLLADGIISQNR